MFLWKMNLQIKGLLFYTKKQTSTRTQKNCNSTSFREDLVTKKKILNQKLKSYNTSNTKLIVIQDTADLKSDILNEINFNKSVLSEKDVTILNLKNEVAKNSYDNRAILAEIKILFLEIENISLSNPSFNENTDSTRTIPVLIYKSNGGLDGPTKEKTVLWLQQRLAKK